MALAPKDHRVPNSNQDPLTEDKNNMAAVTANATRGAAEEDEAGSDEIIPIDTATSNKIQRMLLQQISGEFKDYYPEVVISYATDHRNIDAQGAGPGMVYAAAVALALQDWNIPCFTGLHVPAGENWRKFMLL